jgi:hypothetical protein
LQPFIGNQLDLSAIALLNSKVDIESHQGGYAPHSRVRYHCHLVTGGVFHANQKEFSTVLGI